MTDSPAEDSNGLEARLRSAEDRLRELEQTVHRLLEQNEKLSQREFVSVQEEQIAQKAAQKAAIY